MAWVIDPDTGLLEYSAGESSSPEEGGGSTVDLSFVTAGAKDILSGAVGASSSGSPVYGSISKKSAATYTPGTSNQTIAAGLYLSGVQTIKGDSNLAAANIRAGKSIFGKAGSFTSDATATAEDILEGKTAGVNGTMITGSLKPSSGGGGSFYLATSFQGVLTEIEVTAGQVATYMEENPVSLVGKYTIVDPAARGTERKWVCNATTAVEGETVSTKVYLRAFDYIIGWDDEAGRDIYEKRWGFAGYDDSYSENAYIYSDSYTGESPFSVTAYEGGMDTDRIVVTPAFAPAVDNEPYGPTSWSGKRMVWGEHPIYISYGAKFDSANGYWIREDEGQPLSINTVFRNLNGKSWIQLDIIGSNWVAWRMYSTDYIWNNAPSFRYEITDGNSSFDIGNIINPFSSSAVVKSQSSDYKPVPTMAMANEGYYPSDSETTGLPIVMESPQVGSIYNEDATVRIGAMYPAK